VEWRVWDGNPIAATRANRGLNRNRCQQESVPGTDRSVVRRKGYTELGDSIVDRGAQ
jgi:hypothetical protein